MITFDNFATGEIRFEHDRFAAFRKVFEIIKDCNCSKELNPDGYLSLDVEHV